MDKKTTFFDKHACDWDNHHTHREYNTVQDIFSNRINLHKDHHILDVATGTGIIIPFLQEKGIKNLFAIDISFNMVKQFRKKHANTPIIQGDYSTNLFQKRSFDMIMIFNAFPHFTDPNKIFINSFQYLRSGGKLIIAHSMNRKELNAHHGIGKDGIFSNDILISNKHFQKLYQRNNFTKIIIENNKYFFSCGTKK